MRSYIWGEITVREGQLSRVDINSGITFLAGDTPPPYRIFAEEVNTGMKVQMAESWGPLPLPAGTYKIDLRELQHGSSRMNLIEELAIEPGQLVEIEF